MLKTVSAAQVQLAFEDDGAPAAPPVVLLHAFPLDARMWNETAALLSRDYRVIRPYWRGFSPHAPPRPGIITQVSLGALAEDVVAICTAQGISRAMIVGCSIGGYVMCALLQLFPELITAAVFCNTRPETDTPDGRETRLRTNRELAEAMGEAHESRAREAFADRMLQRLLGHTSLHERPTLVTQVRAWIEAAALESVIALNDAMARRGDSVEVVRKLRAPAVVIGGEEDVIIPAEVTRNFAALLPHGRAVVIPAAGHLSNLENPGAFHTALTDFLDTV